MIFFKRVVINKTDKTAVILTYPGIGDIVWHLPFLHALAKVSSHKQIYLYTRSTTLAKDILKYDKKIAKVFYLRILFVIFAQSNHIFTSNFLLKKNTGKEKKPIKNVHK